MFILHMFQPLKQEDHLSLVVDSNDNTYVSFNKQNKGFWSDLRKACIRYNPVQWLVNYRMKKKDLKHHLDVQKS